MRSQESRGKRLSTSLNRPFATPAACLASAVAVLLVALAAMPAASGAATRDPAPAFSSSQPMLRAAVGTPSIAEKTLQLLAEGVVFGAGGKGFGWVLQAFGLEEGMGADDLAGIRTELADIKKTLEETQKATAQLRLEVTKGTFTTLTQLAVKFTGPVNEGMTKLEEIARMEKHDPTKKGFTEATQQFIKDKLMNAEQLELAEQIEGSGGGEGLAVLASKVAAASPYWTDHTSAEVREVLEYYQGEEARMLTLRVEYMNTRPDIYSRKTIDDEIQRVRHYLESQKALLKPSPPADTIADTRSNLMYGFQAIGGKYKFPEAAARLREGDCGGTCWRIAGGPTIAPLIQGWTGSSWYSWLNEKTGGSIPSLAALGTGFEGVWTEAQCPHGNEYPTRQLHIYWWCKGSFLKPDGTDEIVNVHSGRGGPETLENGYILAKDRSESYWW
jgi:hypothetical protein